MCVTVENKHVSHAIYGYVFSLTLRRLVACLSQWRAGFDVKRHPMWDLWLKKWHWYRLFPF
jgi:hypothetical protein